MNLELLFLTLIIIFNNFLPVIVSDQTDQIKRDNRLLLENKYKKIFREIKREEKDIMKNEIAKKPNTVVNIRTVLSKSLHTQSKSSEESDLLDPKYAFDSPVGSPVPILSMSSKLYPVFSSIDLVNPVNTIKKTLAIVICHGILRNADLYFQTALKIANHNKNSAKIENTIVIAPQFVNNAMIKDIANKDMYITFKDGPTWQSGLPSDKVKSISSYDIIDDVIKRLSDINNFPALHQIIVIGYSAGAQIVNHYAAVARKNYLIDIKFVVGAPSSFLYLDSFRPRSVIGATGYDNWKYGLSATDNIPYITGRYGADPVKRRATIQKNFRSQKVSLCVGTADLTSGDNSPAANTQGLERYERAVEYVKNLQTYNLIDPNNFKFAQVPDVAHDAPTVLTADECASIIFSN